MKNVSWILLSTLLVAGAFSCKKKTDQVATGTFYLHMHSNIYTHEIDDTTVLYKDSTGRHFSLSTAQFYISNITLQNQNGSTYTFPGTYILKDIDSEQYLIGNAPAGTYTTVSFTVGVDAMANTSTPSNYPVTSPLSNAGMWYGNTTKGYIFLKLHGKADTTATQNGTNPVPFQYEIGGAGNLRTVTMPIRGVGDYAGDPAYKLQAGQTQYIHMVCDYGKLLSAVNFKDEDSADSYTVNPTLATKIANNIPSMFSYEE